MTCRRIHGAIARLEKSLAQVRADFDQLRHQPSQALALGDLRLGAVHLRGRDGTVPRAALLRPGQHPVGPVALGELVGAAASGLAALAVALQQGAGPQVADGGEFPEQLLTVGSEGPGIEWLGQGAFPLLNRMVSARAYAVDPLSCCGDSNLALPARESSTGSETRLGRISRRGNRYVRTLHLHSACTGSETLVKRSCGLGNWLRHVLETKQRCVAIVALSARVARPTARREIELVYQVQSIDKAVKPASLQPGPGNDWCGGPAGGRRSAPTLAATRSAGSCRPSSSRIACSPSSPASSGTGQARTRQPLRVFTLRRRLARTWCPGWRRSSPNPARAASAGWPRWQSRRPSPRSASRCVTVAPGQAGACPARECCRAGCCPFRCRNKWWALQDSNLQPTDYESAALTIELRALLGSRPPATRIGPLSPGSASLAPHVR